MTEPTLSVLMPVYNAERFIEEALGSLLPQLGPADEVRVQDALSTDGTVAILERIAGADARVKVVSERDRGQSDALNRALSLATGEYVMWMNADDLLGRGALSDVRRVLAPGVGLVSGGHAILRADGSVIAEYRPGPLDFERLMLRGCYIFSGSIVWRRDVLVGIGGFDVDLAYCMDLDLLFRSSRIDRDGMRVVPSTIGMLRWHDASKSGSQGSGFVREAAAVRRRYRRNRRHSVTIVGAAVTQYLALRTVRLRHSPLYRRLRGRGGPP